MSLSTFSGVSSHQVKLTFSAVAWVTRVWARCRSPASRAARASFTRRWALSLSALDGGRAGAAALASGAGLNATWLISGFLAPLVTAGLLLFRDWLRSGPWALAGSTAEGGVVLLAFLIPSCTVCGVFCCFA